MMRALVFTLLLSLGLAMAQQRLIVNGVEVPGLTTTLVAGSSYAAAEPLARALGASFSFDPINQLALFQLAGRVVLLNVFSDARSAAAASEAILLDGRRFASSGGVLIEGVVFAPVRSLAVAFGGSAAVVQEQNAVTVVLPRARLERAELGPAPGGRYERFVFEFSGLPPIDTRELPALNTVQFRFDRSDLTAERRFSGRYFVEAVLVPNAGRIDFRLTLTPDSRYEWYVTPTPQGTSIVIDIFSAAVTTAPTITDRPRPSVVLDPGPGTLMLAQQLAASLEAAGYPVRLTRDSEVEVPLMVRANAGIGAGVFISLKTSTLPPGQYRAYYLAEAADLEGLNAAIRQNAEAAARSEATDSLRRRLLLGLAPDLMAGPQLAQVMTAALSQAGNFAPLTVEGAPLLILTGAAGRGVVLELSSSDLASATVRQRLVDGLSQALEQFAAR
jgi:hypothetical protein